MKRPNLTHHRGSLTRMSDTAQRLDELAAMDMAAARAWEDLPEADADFDPAERSTPHADTG